MISKTVSRIRHSEDKTNQKMRMQTRLKTILNKGIKVCMSEA